MDQRHGPFIGRIQELEQIRHAVDRSLSGASGVVALAGEPGIGKTRVAQQLEQHATERGAQVYWGQCYEDGGLPPYWPWVQALGAFVRAHDAETLGSLIGDRLAEIAQLVPEVESKLGDLERPSDLSPGDARHRLFNTVTSLLRHASSFTPLVLVLEDLHWADEPSLQLIRFVARELESAHVLLVLTYRDIAFDRRHPLIETLGELSRNRLFERIVLRGLSEQEVGLYIEAFAEDLAEGSTAAEVFAQTEGNPFFVSEVVRLLAEQGPRDGGGTNIETPEGVRDVVGLRLNKLSEACNEALTAAALIGRDFALVKLAPVLDVEPAQLLRDFEEATAAQIIRESGFGTYSFTHALIQQAVAEWTSPGERIRLHAQIAEALETLYAGRAADHAAELAYHFTQAQLVTGPERVCRYLLMAGDNALTTYAYELAREYFEKVLAIKSGNPDDGVTAEALFGLAKVLHHDFPREAWASATRAFNYFVSAGQIERAVAVAIYPLFYTPGVPNIAELTTRALEMVPADSVEAGKLLTRYGMLHNLAAGDFQESSDALKRGLAITKRTGDQRLEMEALATAADVAYYHLRHDEVLEKAEQVIQLAQAFDDPFAQVWPRWLQLTTRLKTGLINRQDQLAAELLSQAERTQIRGFLANAYQLNGLVHLLRGRFVEARYFYQRCREVLPGFYGSVQWQAPMEYEVGDFQAGEELVKNAFAIANEFPPGPIGEYAMIARIPLQIARITGQTENFDVAERAGNLVIDAPTVLPLMDAMARTGLAMLAVHRGDGAGAKEHYGHFLQFRKQMVFGAISGDSLLGLLARTFGAFDAAVEHFEDALAFNSAAGFLPILAWANHDYAETLLMQGESSDSRRAADLIAEGRDIADRLGMPPLKARLDALLQAADSAPARAPKFPDGLTLREVEILRLVSQGRTNEAIGKELVVSARTVSTHLTNILTKIGAANRAEAAAYATRHQLA